MNKTKYRMIVFLILASSALGPACSESQPFRATTTTESGIPVVKNPDRPLRQKAVLKLTAEYTLSGGAEGDDRFSTIDSFAVDGEGTFFVCDERAALIKTYSGRGVFQRSIRTSTPEMGELENPQIVGITAGGELAVESSGHGKLVFFSVDGRFLGRYPWPLSTRSGWASIPGGVF